MFTIRPIRTVALAMIVAFVAATPAHAEDNAVDVSPSFTATTCAKMARLAESGKWTTGKNPGVLFSTPRVHTISIAPESAPEWVRDILNGVKRQTTVVVSAESADIVDARCYYRNTKNKWQPLGAARIPGVLQLDYPVNPPNCCEKFSAPKFEPLLSEAECATLVSKVASTNAWRPKKLSPTSAYPNGYFRSVSRSFVGLEDFWNNSTLKKATEATSYTPIRLEGINSYFVINAVNAGPGLSFVNAECFVYDPTFSTWIPAARATTKDTITLPNPA